MFVWHMEINGLVVCMPIIFKKIKMSSGYVILEFSAPTSPDSTLVIQNLRGSVTGTTLAYWCAPTRKERRALECHTEENFFFAIVTLLTLLPRIKQQELGCVLIL